MTKGIFSHVWALPCQENEYIFKRQLLIGIFQFRWTGIHVVHGISDDSLMERPTRQARL